MKRVLVCDDDPGILEIIKIVLEQGNFEVKTLENGRAIQKRIKQYQPDVILLDIWMPGISGSEIIPLLKKDKQMAKIPVIVISALDRIEEIAKKYGADDFLEKPFDNNALVSLVEKYTK